MTIEQAKQLHVGDAITYQGEERIISSVRTSGPFPPYFRLEFGGGMLISYRLCGSVAVGEGRPA